MRLLVRFRLIWPVWIVPLAGSEVNAAGCQCFHDPGVPANLRRNAPPEGQGIRKDRPQCLGIKAPEYGEWRGLRIHECGL